MPQISSMNWIMISMISIAFLLIMKTNFNKTFISSKMYKKNLTKKMISLKW